MLPCLTLSITKVRIKGKHVPEADIITIKKKQHLFDISKDGFLPDEFQMTAIVLVSVINKFLICRITTLV